MKRQHVGYIRVSSEEQNPERQLEGVKTDRHFIDKASAKDTNRPALTQLLDFVREGDTVVVHSMDRLARNLTDLRNLVTGMTTKGIHVQFVKENLTFDGNDAPMSVLLLSVMGAFAEFERSLLKERQREGIALAKRRGVYRGRKPSLTEEQVLLLKNRIQAGAQKSSLAKELGISRETLYQYLRKE